MKYKKKSQLMILSVLFLFVLMLYVYSTGTSNYYNIETRGFYIVNNIIYETCNIANNNIAENLSNRLESFENNISAYCREFNWKCDIDIINLSEIPPGGNWSKVNKSLYEFELNYSDLKYKQFKRFNC